RQRSQCHSVDGSQCCQSTMDHDPPINSRSSFVYPQAAFSSYPLFLFPFPFPLYLPSWLPYAIYQSTKIYPSKGGSTGVFLINSGIIILQINDQFISRFLAFPARRRIPTFFDKFNNRKN